MFIFPNRNMYEEMKEKFSTQEKKLADSLAECEVLENAIMDLSKSML